MTSIQDFVKITGTGLAIATPAEVRASLIARYKSVYGSDIDLSTGTADGNFVNELTILISNILGGMQTIYSNMNVNNANGIYLDALCALSNIKRKQATKSNTTLSVTNDSDGSQTFTNITFVDQAGQEWLYTGTVTFTSDETKSLYVECTTPGAITAPAGWINQTLLTQNLTVVQANTANVGQTIETDSQLRARRNQSSSTTGTTVLESLMGALKNVSGIEDVKIYNNNSASTITTSDSTGVLAHDIYIILHKPPGITIDDSLIGTIIHNKLTPGIKTTESQCLASNGIHKSYTYVTKIQGIEITESNQVVYWKEAVANTPSMTITLTINDYFDRSANSTSVNTIGQAMISYMNALQIGVIPSNFELMMAVQNADPLFKSKATYVVNTISFSATSLDTFFNYTTIGTPTITGNTCTFTIS